MNVHKSLQRYPLSRDRSLVAWDSADELILNTVEESNLKVSNILIVNDSFGALSTALSGLNIKHINDSYLSRKAIEINHNALNLEKPCFTGFCNLEDIELVLIKIPKSRIFFKWQLQNIVSLVKNGTEIVAAGKAKNLPISFYNIFKECCSESEYSLIEKKSRFYWGHSIVSKKTPDLVKTFRPDAFPETKIISLPGVFSSGKEDPGSSFLLSCFSKVNPPQLVVDLGCGSGLLSAVAAELWKECNIIGCDESIQAIESSRLTSEANNYSNRIELFHTHLMNPIEEELADLIICNPPFHQKNTNMVDVAFSMIEESYRVLKDGGQLIVVSNKHLGYQKHISSVFDKEVTVFKSSVYIVYLVTK